MSRAEQAIDQAAAFIIAQEDGDWTDATQAAFEAWLTECDGNKIAYLRLKHGWREADRIAALGWVGKETATSIDARRWPFPAAIAASLVAMVITGYMASHTAVAPSQSVGTITYRTPIGGDRLVPLADGSKMQLNTASLVRTAVSEKRREVWLDKGEAFFEVRHLKGRPFVVHAGSREITVLGTKFAVRRDGEKVVVSVLEGRVRVEDITSNSDARSSIISGGDIALAQGDATLVTARSEERVKSALAWRSGMLSFEQSSLSEAAAEFNRYNIKPMIIGSDVAGVEIGGIFPASRPDAFVDLLRDAYGLKVIETKDSIKISN